MADNTKTTGFWQTVPGILTAFAAIITAVAGLLLALYQAGFLGGAKSPAGNASPANAISTSETAAKPNQSSETLNISGTWRDDDGTVYEIWQEGPHYRFTASLRDFRSEGRITLTGRELTSTFATNYGFTGNGWGTVSADGNEIKGGFVDSNGNRHPGRMYRDR
ncbi:MAG TPA: hypothetical protein DC054_21770 [Blastocatellia bacterium]|nr:hypothetical protein [Blastocatellia bacterium]